MFRNRKFVASTGLLGCVVASAVPARAAYILTSAGQTVTENFNGFQGTAATVPTNITLGGTQAATFNGVFIDGTSAYSTANGVYAGTQSANTADNALTVRVPGSGTLTATFTITNNTGAALNGFRVNYNVEQYEDADIATTNTITLASDNGSGTTTFDQTRLTGTFTATSQNAGNRVGCVHHPGDDGSVCHLHRVRSERIVRGFPSPVGRSGRRQPSHLGRR